MPLVPLTLVEVFGGLAGVATAVGAALLLSGALSVVIAALHAGRREAAGALWRWAAALLHRQHRLEELTAGNALPVLLGKHPLHESEGERSYLGPIPLYPLSVTFSRNPTSNTALSQICR